MKASCDRASLLEGIQTVQKAVSPRSTLPILGNLLLETRDGDRMRIMAYDLEIGIVTTIPARVEQAGAVTIPARVLSEVVSILPEAPVSFGVDERHNVQVTCERSNYSLRGLPAEEFPRLPQVDGAVEVEVQGDVLAKMIRHTRFASSPNDARPILTGVLTILNGNEIQLVATDANRLAWSRGLLARPVGERAEAIVPARAYGEVGRLIGSSSDPVRVTMATSQIRFEIGPACVQSRLIDGQYPNWERVIPSTHDKLITVALEDLQRAVRRVGIVAREDGNKVILDIAADYAVLSAQSHEVGRAEEEVTIRLEGEPMKIAFNTRFLNQVLEILESKDITIELRESDNPGVIKPVGDDTYLYLVMPMVLS